MGPIAGGRHEYIYVADGADRAWTVLAVRLPLALTDPAQQARLMMLLEGSNTRQ